MGLPGLCTCDPKFIQCEWGHIGDCECEPRYSVCGGCHADLLANMTPRSRSLEGVTLNTVDMQLPVQDLRGGVTLETVCGAWDPVPRC